MNISTLELKELIKTTVQETITSLGLVNAPQPKKEFNERNAYQKTEQLLYMYNNLKKVLEDKMQLIHDLKKYGVPQQCGVMKERVQTSIVQPGIVLPEESVENAVRNVQASVEDIVQLIAMIDKGLESLKYDPYYPILEMLYFDGRTQEDIGIELHTTQKTISINKTRLVRELSLCIFPDQVIKELLN